MKICSNFKESISNINPAWLVYCSDSPSFYNLSTGKKVNEGECIGVNPNQDNLILFKHIKEVKDSDWPSYSKALSKIPHTSDDHLKEDLDLISRENTPYINLETKL